MMDATPHTTPHEAARPPGRLAEPAPRPADAASASAAEPEPAGAGELALAMFASAELPVRDRLAAFLALGSNIEQVGKAIGRSPRSVSEWYHEQFNGDNERMERAIGHFLGKRGLQATPVFRPSFKYTGVAEDVIGALLQAQLDADIALIAGASGVGKTSAAKRYAETERGCYYISFSAAWTSQSMVHEIARQVQLDRASKPLDALCREIVDCLRDSGALLIVDEAQHADGRALEILRSIYDEAHIGLALISQLEFMAVLRRGDGRTVFDQLLNRVGLTVVIRQSSLVDLAAVLPEGTPLPVLKRLHSASKGCMRHAVKAFSRALRAAATHGDGKVTVPLLKQLESS